MLKNKPILKLAILAALSAIGFVLMTYVKIPFVAPLSFLEIEISDFIVILVLLLFGFKEAVLVAIIKTLCQLAIVGPVGLYGVGQITAIIASISYCLGMILFKKLINNKNIGYKILGYFSLVVLFTGIMTIANYFVLTPIYIQTFGLNKNDFVAMVGANNYLVAIIFAYVPFNFIKGTIVSIVAATIGVAVTKMFESRYKNTSIIT